MPRQRHDPDGRLLPHRMHAKHGAYYHVAGNRWRALGRDYAAALAKWAEIEGGELAPRTVAEAWAVYAGSSRGLLGLAEATRRHYRGAFTRSGGLLDVFGHMPLDDLRRSDILAFLEAREAAGSAVAGNRDVGALAALYRFARDRDWTAASPCGVKRNPELPRHRVASASEIAALRLAATPLWRALIALALRLGPRESEIRLLHRRHILADALVIERPKTKRASEFPFAAWPGLREIVDAALAAHPRPSVWLFPCRGGGPYTAPGFRSTWRRLRARAGVDDLMFLDLRRTAATQADSLALARGMLGHTTEAMTARVYRPRDRVEP